ncbi:MAG: phospholipase [Proteobacteria bacterium]|nr:phospholipase [Pseudomonadota bacterium]
MKHDLQDIIDIATLPLVHRVRSGSAAHGPCLLLLHGVGANEAGLIHFAEAQDPRLTVILARAPLAFGPGQYGWFQVRFTAEGPAINPQQAEQSRQTLVDFIDSLPAAYGVDRQRIWIAGFSQGGILSASVGLTRPDKVAGFGILSGRILPEIAPLIAPATQLADLHAFISHGVSDSKLTIEFARKAQSQLTAASVRLAYHEYPADHELTPAMQRDFHDWLQQQIDGTPA